MKILTCGVLGLTLLQNTDSNGLHVFFTALSISRRVTPETGSQPATCKKEWNIGLEKSLTVYNSTGQFHYTGLNLIGGNIFIYE